MLSTGLVLLLLIGIFALVLNGAKKNLREQTVAKRWSKEGDYAQNSIFFSKSAQIGFENIRQLRYEIEKSYREKSVVATFEGEEGQAPNLKDCYSSFSSISLSTDYGNGSFTAIAVGGDFFYFHPVQLVSGNYFSEDDLMNDYILLDEDTAWKLFGSSDVAGMRVSCGPRELYVAGVYVRSKSEIDNLAAGGDEPRVFVSYDVLKSEAGENIICYELLSPNPIPNFASDVLTNIKLFPVDEVQYVQNSTRFSYKRYFDLLKNRKSREMRTDDIAYPYWENVARYKEGRMMYVAYWQWVCAAILFVIVFVNLMVFLAKHKPSKETFTKIGDKIYEWRGKRKTKQISFDAGEDVIPVKLYEDDDEALEEEDSEGFSEEEQEEEIVDPGEIVHEEETVSAEYVQAEMTQEEVPAEYEQAEAASEEVAPAEYEQTEAVQEAVPAETTDEAYAVYSNPANAYGYITNENTEEEGTDDE